MMGVLDGMTSLDHDSYVEKRLQDGRRAEAQRDAVVAQAARRHMAIVEAVRRLQKVEQSNRGCTLTRAALSKTLAEIASDLQTANQVRATDEGGLPDEIQARR
jgi:hypothetical protein